MAMVQEKMVQETLEGQMQDVPCSKTPEEMQRTRGKVEEREDGKQPGHEGYGFRVLEQRDANIFSPNYVRKLAEAARNDDDERVTSRRDVGASGDSPTVPGQVELDPGTTPRPNSRWWARQRQLSQWRGRIRTAIKRWRIVRVSPVKMKDKTNTRSQNIGVRLGFSMALLVERTKKLLVENDRNIIVYTGLENRKKEQAEEAWRQLKGWRVAAEEVVKKGKKQRLNKAGPVSGMKNFSKHCGSRWLMLGAAESWVVTQTWYQKKKVRPCGCQVMESGDRSNRRRSKHLQS